MCILLFGINRNSPSNFRSLARIFLLPLELRSWATPVMASLTAQLWSSKGRRKIRARDLKSLGELRFIPNKPERARSRTLFKTFPLAPWVMEFKKAFQPFVLHTPCSSGLMLHFPLKLYLLPPKSEQHNKNVCDKGSSEHGHTYVCKMFSLTAIISKNLKIWLINKELYCMLLEAAWKDCHLTQVLFL